MSFYIWKDIDALDYVSRIQNKYPSLKGTPVADLLKKWGFYRLPGGSVGYFHDYLHPPVNGYEVLVVPQSPSIPNQPLLPGVPNGSYIANNAQPAIKFTEIGSEAVVTGGGVATAVSSAVATAAVGAAIGFGVGVNWFETYPEQWTRISNKVFGTNLDPERIGEMTRDSNALMVIAEGVGYMFSGAIDAIKDALIDEGFTDTRIEPPDPLETVTGTVTTLGSMSQMWGEVDNYLYGITNAGTHQVEYDVLRSRPEYAEVHLDDYGDYRTARVYIGNGESPDVPFTTDFRSWGQQAYPSIKQTVNAYRSTDSEHVLLTAYKGEDTLTYERKTRRTAFPYLWGDEVSKDPQYPNNRVFTTLNTSISYEYPLFSPTGIVGKKGVSLETTYPEWWERGIDLISGVDENGQPIYTRWLPVTLPSNNPMVDGIPYDQTKAQEGALPDDDTQVAEQVKTGTKDLTDNYPQVSTPTKPPTVNPTPPAPPITGGGGSATGLANLYNPTLAQVKQFSRWLWGSEGLNLDQLKKLLQDPMQAIIGLHVMYATPTTGADRDIQVGYINSGVTSKIVTEQYTEIDCGTVTINEYFGDARDYSPFTQVYCYLPFIGIVELNADDVVNSTLGIKYKIDVLTGCCLAQLTVKKYGLDAVLYTYTGNCAVQMPITSGNYLSTVSSLLGAVVSGAAAVATGGALAPVAIGAAANAMGGGARASVAMSGSLGSNAGAMGIRKPYLIIKRVESADANGYNEFYGYPTNKRVNLSQLTGYVRVKEINLSGTNATEDEQNEIVTLLKEGVIL